MGDETLGDYLGEVRRVAGLTLRDVQERTNGAVKNGYLSQIEHGTIARPAPEALWHLAEVYGIDYNDLLTRARHRVAAASQPPDELAGIPLSAIRDLDEADRQTLRDYIEFLANRRRRS